MQNIDCINFTFRFHLKLVNQYTFFVETNVLMNKYVHVQLYIVHFHAHVLIPKPVLSREIKKSFGNIHVHVNIY